VTTETALSISEAAAAASVSPHTLRYYERAGLMPPIGRATSSGHRLYSPRDVEWIIFLTRLRATGMPIRRMRKYADLLRAGPGTDAARLALLEEHRDSVRRRLNEIEANLALIEIKINFQRERIKNSNGATPK
jgi:DNA-binding transcriptional MerR regulator